MAHMMSLRSDAMLGYARVSTEDQASNGYGLDAQERRLREAFEHRGWGFELCVDQGASGKTLERPALRSAMDRIARGETGGLVVAKLDRLTRSLVDFCRLLDWFDEAGAVLVALDFDLDTSTPGGRLVAQIFAAVAEWERGMIGVRTRDGLAVRRAQGLPIARPSVVDEPALVARIRRLRGEGLAYREIADRLNVEGVPTLRGGRVWRASALQGVLGGGRKPAARRVSVLPEIRRTR